MTLDDVEMLILKYCSDGFAPMKPLYDKAPRTSIHRRVSSLVDNGYLDKNNHEYRTTSKGQLAMKEDEAGINWNLLEQKIPHLKYITNELQRSLIELFLPAMIARKDEISKKHHPTFVLFGPTFFRKDMDR